MLVLASLVQSRRRRNCVKSGRILKRAFVWQPGVNLLRLHNEVKYATLRKRKNEAIQTKIPSVRAADAFIDQRLALGRVAFPLADLIKETGLSVTAARNQLLRLGNRVTRVSPRHQFFLIVSPEHRAVGAPPGGVVASRLF